MGAFLQNLSNSLLNLLDRNAPTTLTITLATFTETGRAVKRRLEKGVEFTAGAVALRICDAVNRDGRRTNGGSNVNRACITTHHQISSRQQCDKLRQRAPWPDDSLTFYGIGDCLSGFFFSIIAPGQQKISRPPQDQAPRQIAPMVQ
jgi:hypothetical protein